MELRTYIKQMDRVVLAAVIVGLLALLLDAVINIVAADWLDLLSVATTLLVGYVGILVGRDYTSRELILVLNEEDEYEAV